MDYNLLVNTNLNLTVNEIEQLEEMCLPSNKGNYAGVKSRMFFLGEPDNPFHIVSENSIDLLCNMKSVIEESLDFFTMTGICTIIAHASTLQHIRKACLENSINLSGEFMVTRNDMVRVYPPNEQYTHYSYKTIYCINNFQHIHQVQPKDISMAIVVSG